MSACVDTTMGAKKEATKEEEGEKEVESPSIEFVKGTSEKKSCFEQLTSMWEAQETHSWGWACLKKRPRGIEREINHRTCIAGEQ